MKNTDFYIFCRDHRRTETDPNKQQALTEVYDFMRECGTTKAGLKMFVDHMVYKHSDDASKVAAYQWLLDVFDGPSEFVVPDGQMMLF